MLAVTRAHVSSRYLPLFAMPHSDIALCTPGHYSHFFRSFRTHKNHHNSRIRTSYTYTYVWFYRMYATLWMQIRLPKQMQLGRMFIFCGSSFFSVQIIIASEMHSRRIERIHTRNKYVHGRPCLSHCIKASASLSACECVFTYANFVIIVPSIHSFFFSFALDTIFFFLLFQEQFVSFLYIHSSSPPLSTYRMCALFNKKRSEAEYI